MENVKYMTMQNFKAKYGSESACMKALLRFRMSEDGLCFNPVCKAPIDRFYHVLKGRRCFICARCLRHYYVQAGSIFHNSHIPMNHWFEIIFRLLLSRNGIATSELQREYGYSYKSLFRMMHRIRELMGESLSQEIANLQIEYVEADESYVPTGKKGYGKHHPFKKGRGSLRNTTILAILERRGFAKLIAIPDATAKTIIPLIIENVPKTATIFTDSWGAYNTLTKLGYNHARVNHNEKEYVNYETSASTNSCEGLFSNFKRMLGVHRNFSHDKLQGYLSEGSFKHTFRFEEDYGFTALMQSLGSLSYVYDEHKLAA